MFIRADANFSGCWTCVLLELVYGWRRCLDVHGVYSVDCRAFVDN